MTRRYRIGRSHEDRMELDGKKIPISIREREEE